MEENEKIKLLDPYMKNNMYLLKALTHRILSKMNEKLYGLDYDDFYSIANMTSWQACIKYNEERNCNFNTYLTSCLTFKFKSEIRDRHRAKRIINYIAYSLENIEEEINSDIWLAETQVDVECKVIELQDHINLYNNIRQYIPDITNLQIQILEYLIEGYHAKEIQSLLYISQYEYSKNIKSIKYYKTLYSFC